MSVLKTATSCRRQAVEAEIQAEQITDQHSRAGALANVACRSLLWNYAGAAGGTCAARSRSRLERSKVGSIRSIAYARALATSHVRRDPHRCRSPLPVDVVTVAIFLLRRIA